MSRYKYPDVMTLAHDLRETLESRGSIPPLGYLSEARERLGWPQGRFEKALKRLLGTGTVVLGRLDTVIPAGGFDEFCSEFCLSETETTSTPRP